MITEDITPSQASAIVNRKRKSAVDQLSVSSSRESRSSKRQTLGIPPPWSPATREQSKGKVKTEVKATEVSKKEKAEAKERKVSHLVNIPPRHNLSAKKSKSKELPTETKYYPYISAGAKASLSGYIQKKKSSRREP